MALKRRHVLMRTPFDGREQVDHYVPSAPSRLSEAWGFEMTVHVYGEGEMPSVAAMGEAANRAAEYVGANDFVGVDCKIIEEGPLKQGGKGAC